MLTAIDRYRHLIASDIDAVVWSCTLEATAPKFGNVHPTAAFRDLCFSDFCSAAKVLAESCFHETSAGSIVLRAVSATEQKSNINLGIALLIAPLFQSMASLRQTKQKPKGLLSRDELRHTVPKTLTSLTPADARHVFEAIRIANPGGLGSSEKYDVRTHDSAPDNLIEAMGIAQDRDLIAKQYTTNFETVFDSVIPAIEQAVNETGDLLLAIRRAQLALLSEFPDSLIARKCGVELAEEVQQRAREVYARQSLDTLASECLAEDFDLWLRDNGNQKNPGAIADLIAAALFVMLTTR